MKLRLALLACIAVAGYFVAQALAHHQPGHCRPTKNDCPTTTTTTAPPTTTPPPTTTAPPPTTTTVPEPPPAAPQTRETLAAPGPFGTPAPSWTNGAAWQPDSNVYANRLRSVATQIIMTVGSYGVAEYFASSTDPLTTVVNTNNWGTAAGTTPLRVPEAAKPASGTDAHMVVVQPDGSAVEMWKAARRLDGGFTAGAVAISQPGQYGYAIAGCRGSSFALAAGAILPAEIAAGQINHALLIVLPSAVVRRASVYPSTDSDGTNYLADSLPEGARLVLDPAADLTGLSALERTVAVALQRYGAYVGDKTSGTDVSVTAVAPESWTSFGLPDPWAAQGVSGYPSLARLLPLLTRLRVAAFVDLRTF